jgi:hypothetical protein
MPSKEEDRREALIRAAQLARVRPGLDYDEAVDASDAAAAHLLEFMRVNGEFALGLLQASSYLLSGTSREDYETLSEVSNMTDYAIRIAPRNPDVLRRAYTIFQRLMPDLKRSQNDIIITDANWETLPERELLE